jgi:hypothetical protein
MVRSIWILLNRNSPAKRLHAFMSWEQKKMSCEKRTENGQRLFDFFVLILAKRLRKEVCNVR